jgi:hypothetical protein
LEAFKRFTNGGVLGILGGLVAMGLSGTCSVVKWAAEKTGAGVRMSFLNAANWVTGQQLAEQDELSLSRFAKGGPLTWLVGGFALAVAGCLVVLGLSNKGYQSIEYGLGKTKELVTGVKPEKQLTPQQFLQGGVFGVAVGSAPNVILAALYAFAVPVTFAFRVVIRRPLQALRGLGRAIGLWHNPEQSQQVENIEALKQYSIFNKGAWKTESKQSQAEIKANIDTYRTPSFWRGLIKDIYRAFSLNISSFRERVLEIVKVYAKAHDGKALSILKDIELEKVRLLDDGSLTYGDGLTDEVSEQVAQFFRDNGQAFIALRERYQDRVTDDEFTADIIRTLQYVGDVVDAEIIPAEAANALQMATGPKR